MREQRGLKHWQREAGGWGSVEEGAARDYWGSRRDESEWRGPGCPQTVRGESDCGRCYCARCRDDDARHERAEGLGKEMRRVISAEILCSQGQARRGGGGWIAMGRIGAVVMLEGDGGCRVDVDVDAEGAVSRLEQHGG